MGLLKEFKDFALKGNVIDLAVAVVIGGAFSAIVSSLVEHVITPLLLNPALKAANVQDLDKLVFMDTVKYGSFLSAVIKFVIIAFILFLLVKGMNAIKKKEEMPAPPPAPKGPSSEELLTEIRDLLKK